jgi:hypothetical protein
MFHSTLAKSGASLNSSGGIVNPKLQSRLAAKWLNLNAIWRWRAGAAPVVCGPCNGEGRS